MTVQIAVARATLTVGVLAGALGLCGAVGGVCGAVGGVCGAVAHADPGVPPWLPVDPGPRVGAGLPGPAYSPPPGHRAGLAVVVPMWAPPPPGPPSWAPWLPVVWNADLPAWGVWWNGGFIRL